MKKFIAGVVVGVLLFGIAFVLSSSIRSRMNVQKGIYSIKKIDGTLVSEGAVLGGIVYAPVRAMAAAVGAPLTVEGKTIFLGEPGSSQNPTEVKVLSNETLEWTNRINHLRGVINKCEVNIAVKKGELTTLDAKIKEEKASKQKSPDRLKMLEADIKESNKYIIENQRSITTAEEEILELQKKIDASK
ncbi:hypothetical protein M3201_24975 [Paenibacillus motobuensis]|uniref:hypothetical protein n=1 Tax=Paenibacillus TaxID=44249 RepID=UPI0020423294|nr:MULTISPECIES: hypothetical protein [Paenibacillus]MCM3042917.1 hypothetical protein [Paenibacillus lutimineralis]MCM3650021.1 hypothetical protein [Paenibacillus motobuensis]